MPPTPVTLKVQGIATTAEASRDQMASSVFASPSRTARAKPGQPEITRFGK
jgi:hypothetical protein